MDMEAMEDGFIAKILKPAGSQDVSVGEVLSHAISRSTLPARAPVAARSAARRSLRSDASSSGIERGGALPLAGWRFPPPFIRVRHLRSQRSPPNDSRVPGHSLPAADRRGDR